MRDDIMCLWAENLKEHIADLSSIEWHWRRSCRLFTFFHALHKHIDKLYDLGEHLISCA